MNITFCHFYNFYNTFGSCISNIINMLNHSRFVLNSFRPFENVLLDNIKILISQQKRTTYVVKRKYPPGLYKKSGPAFGEKLKHKHFIYEVLQHPYQHKQKPLDIILLDYVEGLGEKGDRLLVKPTLAYTKLLLPGLAVYASPENIAKFAMSKDNRETKYSTPFVERTMNILSVMPLSVSLNVETQWILERWHIKTALRKAGVHCPEEAITLPEKAITGPDLSIQGKEFYITITINKKETVKVRCRIHHCHINPAMNIPLDPEHYRYPAEPIFPEDREILNSLPRHRQAKDLTTSTFESSEPSTTENLKPMPQDRLPTN